MKYNRAAGDGINLGVAMDTVQCQHEQAVGDRFIQWLNRRHGTNFTPADRDGEAPDLIYVDGRRKLRIEIVGAYYDSGHAKFLWGHARQASDTPEIWSGRGFDQELIRDIERQIHKKSQRAYGRDCILLVTVQPPLTSKEEVDDHLEEIKLPEKMPFSGVFLAGNFPVTSGSAGGYHVFTLKKLDAFN